MFFPQYKEYFTYLNKRLAQGFMILPHFKPTLLKHIRYRWDNYTIQGYPAEKCVALKAVVFNLRMHQNHLEGLLKYSVSNLVGVGLGLII